MDQYLNQNNLSSLQFEAFLRYTKNKNVQNQILNLIAGQNYSDIISNSIFNLYNSEREIYKQNNKELVRFRYNNLYDENINLFNFKEISLFNNELGLLLPTNEWTILTFTNKNESNKENNLILLCGGGTNSLRVSIKKYIDISEDMINSKVNSLFNVNSYANWKSEELPLTNILSNCGADKYIVAYGIGDDTIPQIKNATINAYLYNKKNNILYEISYFMNFSDLNIHYTYRNRIINYLRFYTLFVYLL